MPAKRLRRCGLAPISGGSGGQAPERTRQSSPDPECCVCGRPIGVGEPVGNAAGQVAHLDCYIEWRAGRKPLRRSQPREQT